jgi:hypothetical protein
MEANLKAIQKGEAFKRKVNVHAKSLQLDKLFYESKGNERNMQIFNSQTFMLEKIEIINNFRELISLDYANERIIPSEKSPRCVELCITLIDFWPDSKKAFFFNRSKTGAVSEIGSISERIPIPNSNELANLDIRVLTYLNSVENKLPKVSISFKLPDSYNEWKGSLCFGFIGNTNNSKRMSEVLFHTYLTKAISMNFKEISKDMLITVDQLFVQAKNRGATEAYLESLNVIRSVININKEQNLAKQEG